MSRSRGIGYDNVIVLISTRKEGIIEILDGLVVVKERAMAGPGMSIPVPGSSMGYQTNPNVGAQVHSRVE